MMFKPGDVIRHFDMLAVVVRADKHPGLIFALPYGLDSKHSELLFVEKYCTLATDADFAKFINNKVVGNLDPWHLEPQKIMPANTLNSLFKEVYGDAIANYFSSKI